jgi:uncharacterized protein YecA (UPF0149 family)
MSKKKKNSHVDQYSVDDGTYSRTEQESGRLSPIIRRAIKVGRNESCPCSSGNKFKNCCKGKKLFLKD